MSVKPILFSSLFVLAGAAQADFNWQVDAAIGMSEVDFDKSDFTDTERDQIGIAGRYYLQTVEVEGKPFREAAFLGKQSSVSIAYGTDEETKPSNSDDEDEILNVFADIRIGQTPFRVGGVIGTHDNDDYSGTRFGVGFGWHIMDVSLLSFETSVETGDDDFGDQDISVFSVGYKHILPLGDTHLNLEADADFTNTEYDPKLGKTSDSDNATFSILAKWYMTQAFGFGAHITTSATDYGDNTALDTDVSRVVAGLISYEFNENIGISFESGVGGGTIEPIIGSDRDYGVFYYELGVQGRF